MSTVHAAVARGCEAERGRQSSPGLRLRWLTERHSLGVEAAVVLVLYALYETSRGLVVGDRAAAVQHAREVASLEGSLHVFVEGHVQHMARVLPGVIDTLGILYLTLHLAVTGGYLLWLHRRRPAAFPLVRTALLLASALAVVGYVLFPTAPPRMAALGIADTISGAHVDLNTGLVSSLYNPFAAVPSMHVGYAVIVGLSLIRHAARPTLRVLGALYPALVLLVVVATGNHLLVDAFAGAAVAAVAIVVSGAMAAALRSSETTRRAPIPIRVRPALPGEAGAPSPRPAERQAA